jgi:predicted transcriptional regulator
VDPHNPERVALISIKPQYAEAIFVGLKTVEFRRSRLASDIEFAIVYATQPVGRILGWFRVAGLAESTPDGLWRRFRRHGAIRRHDYFAYFEGASRAYGIQIVEPTRVIEPFLLDSLIPGLRAPQSFQYLPAPLASSIVERPRPAVRRRRPPRPAFA